MTDVKARLAPSFSAIQNRNYRAVWIGQTASKLGTGAYVIAMAWAVYALTHSTISLAINMLAYMIPQILLLVFGGIIGDRLSRRTVILWCDSLGILVTTALSAAALAHALHFGEIVAASAILGAIAAIYSPAYRAILTDILPGEQIASGNALSAGALNVTRVIGPLLGGALYSFSGIALPLAVDAVSFALAVATMLRVALPQAQVKVKSTVWLDVKEGALYCVRSRLLRYVVIVSIVGNTLVVAPVVVLLPALVQNIHGGSLTLGALAAIQALVTLLVSVILPTVEHRGYRLSVLVVFYAALGFGGLLLGFSDDFAIAAVGCAVLGVGYAVEVIENTMLQRDIPAEMMSRVFSVVMLVSFSLLPLGYLLAGFAATAWGVSNTLRLGAASTLAVCALMLLPLLMHRHTVEVAEAQASLRESDKNR